ncbi:hypothetical protein PSN45_002361 [Yamadazyma tenuis]|uniref:MFS general substrate transporter n=1 Tax=Candida tenuis (strain ATCC 10573 / BCRC 21748 / CBS 615 / JCM 9827 / NBRC 10315 / NRRL Y-1498 / VKM Y-70) TaxID=590646 RepID=G3B0R8_CANTC|nr:uncharacterized protein CANTEDRAFT_102712 [Yamadazyma tenuis ATCC 10573]EGV65460.1 hypothetical protein CANTEDRAFT_102712 [Yamadazyma tenuis ATCC 10573]WEJ94861.1 hypothetical protein PSN45_002361 [Yamadazyma tenuis]
MADDSNKSLEKEALNISEDYSSVSVNLINIEKADATLIFLDAHEQEFAGVELSDEEHSVITNKVHWYLLPLLIAVNTLLFMDKATLSYAAILGIYESTNLTDSLYDDLNSIFYTGYTVGQLLNFVLQKYNLRIFLTIIVFLWSVVVFLHAAAFNFGGLVVLRLVLGILESIVVPALEVSLFQFYTPTQRATIQPVFWIGCVGFPVVIVGFMAYGVLYAKDTIPPWKIFMIINGGITLVMSVIIYIFYPSDPSQANFLTDKEKFFLIKRVQKESKASITQHNIKRHQIIECLRDPITWLFALFSFLIMLANNLNYQQNLLYVSLGVSNLGSTLVSVAGGGFASAFAVFGAILTHYFPNNSFWICVVGCLPSIAGGIAMVTISWSNKLALLAMLVLAANTYFLAYIVGFGWSSSSCSGNTKRYFRHFIFCVAYGIANIISPQLWKGNQTNRYYAAWSVQIVLAWFGTPLVAGVITLILKARNKERLAYIESHPEALFGTVVKIDPETGKEVTEKVDIGSLDLTDLENKTFIYPL